MQHRPFTRAELTTLRQSVAATKSLPPGQILRLLNDMDRLYAERDELVAVMADLAAGPWPELRRLLGGLQRSIDGLASVPPGAKDAAGRK